MQTRHRFKSKGECMDGKLIHDGYWDKSKGSINPDGKGKPKPRDRKIDRKDLFPMLGTSERKALMKAGGHRDARSLRLALEALETSHTLVKAARRLKVWVDGLKDFRERKKWKQWKR